MSESPSSWLAGLWRDNPGLVSMLGLCPMLAVTTTLVAGAALGLVATAALVISSLIISLIRRWIPDSTRVLFFVVIIAAVVTVLQLALNAYLFPLYVVLGMYVTLLATNCLLFERAEMSAYRHDVVRTVVDALVRGVGMTVVLILLGGMREILGSGTLFFGIDRIFGPEAKAHVIHFFPKWYDFHLIATPPGAFICLGILIAFKNRLSRGRVRSGHLVRSAAELQAQSQA